MPTAFDVRALGSRVRVQLDDSIAEDERERIRSQWVDLIVEPDTDPDVTMLGTLNANAPPDEQAAGHQRVMSTSPDRLAAALPTEITLAGIERLGGNALMLHAGAVALDDGRVIALIGPSGMGKTTATATLGRHAGYVSDETLAIFPDGSVESYRKPLSIGSHPGTKQQVAASKAGLGALPSAELAIAALVVLDRREAVARPFVETLSLFEALEELVPQTSFLSKLDRPLRSLVTTILSTGGVRRVVYSEADALPDMVDDLITASTIDTPQLVDVHVMSGADCGCTGAKAEADRASGADAGSGAAIYRRADYRDALSIDDALVILNRNRVTVLDGIGPAVWFAADATSTEELTRAALEQLPPPPEGVDVAEVIAATLEELVSAELLLRS